MIVVSRAVLTAGVVGAAAVALVLVGSAVPVGAADGGRPLSAVMTGAAEAPGPGDPDGSGTADLRVNPGAERVCVDLFVQDIATATAAHIHEAPVGEPGPVVVPLAAPSNGTSSGCYSVERELARDILKNPGDYYVNVHNAQFSAGAVRGQLSR